MAFKLLANQLYHRALLSFTAHNLAELSIILLLKLYFFGLFLLSFTRLKKSHIFDITLFKNVLTMVYLGG